MSDPSRPATGYPIPPPNGGPTTTAYPYPYPAPPPNQPYYPTAGGTILPQQHHSLLLRRLFAFLIILIILLSLASFILYLALRPRLPLFSLNNILLTHLNLSSSSNQFSATWDLSFSVRNPNTKLHVYYDDVVVAVYYRTLLLGQNRLAPFDQGTRRGTNVTGVVVSVVDEFVPKETMDSVIGERGKNGVVSFGVRVMALVRFRAGVWRLRRRVLRVSCGDVGVDVNGGTNGTMVGGTRSCVTYL